MSVRFIMISFQTGRIISGERLEAQGARALCRLERTPAAEISASRSQQHPLSDPALD